jgi:hypothetical protein
MLLSKALIVVRDAVPPLAVPVMFNPPEYELQTTNEYAEVGLPGLGSSVLQFVRGRAKTLSMTLFFDTTDSGVDVRAYSGLVSGLTQLRPQTHRPPRLLFVWGSLAFAGVLESVVERFGQFDPAGLPLRAELGVVLRGDDTVASLLAAVPLESSDKVKSHQVVAGETLASIAAAEYDDPRAWRLIARANGLRDPLTLPPGVRLTLPTATTATPATPAAARPVSA